MELKQLKQLIKSAVKEAISEELKEIILEAIKTPNNNTSLVESNKSSKKLLTSEERKQIFGDIIGEINSGKTINTSHISPFKPVPVDVINGSLPEGEVSLDQIAGLMNR